MTRPRRALLAVAVLAVLIALGLPVARCHLRAAALLTRFSDPAASGLLTRFARGEVDEEDGVLPSAGSARTRLYWPRGASHPPGVVLVHGVHRLGIDEPRMVRFARAIAAAGCAVFTPEVAEIAAYHLEPTSIATIGRAAQAFAARLGRRPGVMGMSFAGGLSLLAAADPRFSDDIDFVVAVGAHDDLARVGRFFATDRAEGPDGAIETLAAHPYGALVLVYGDVETFFAGDDVPVARDAIRLALWEKHDEARARANDLSPAAKERLLALLDHRLGTWTPELVAYVASHAAAMAAVSPHDRMSGIHAAVFLLHGQGDTVIPATETRWLARDVPAKVLRSALVSPAIVHVEIGKGPPLVEQLSLVHFMASVLAAADAEH